MPHKLAHIWRSYKLVASAGNPPALFSDEKDNRMDLTKMKPDGVLDDGSHGNIKITGRAYPVGSLYYLELDHVGTVRRHYEGYLVHDFIRDDIMIVGGKIIFDTDVEFRVADVTLVQDEATWVLTKP